jgi:FKBP-type peptidyl-prolyl cis-trans isomerase SlyD
MSENISKGKVVGFSYELKNSKGEILEKSDQPMEYLHGNNNIIIGLEKEMNGLKVGDSKLVKVKPVDGYGEYDKDLRFEVPRKNFPDDVNIQVGMEFQTETETGPLVIVVKEVAKDKIVVDGNHPLAGQELHFDVKIESLRDATPQELTHGHVHHEGHDHH